MGDLAGSLGQRTKTKPYNCVPGHISRDLVSLPYHPGVHTCGEAFLPTGIVRVDLCPSHSHTVASGIFVRSNEALQVVANVIHANGDRGITIVQSSQLTRVANNSISCNRQSGVKVEFQCKVELRGNGIYDNRGHGIITKGDGTAVVENDIIGNRGSGLQLLPRSDTKVSV